MDDRYILKRIPYDQEFNYEETKGSIEDSFNKYLNQGNTISKCIHGAFYLDWDTDMDENGMSKFVYIIAGMLFMMEHNAIDEDVIITAVHDIEVFENGDYEDLFTPEDLKLLKDDIEIVKKWLNEHKEYWQD